MRNAYSIRGALQSHFTYRSRHWSRLLFTIGIVAGCNLHAQTTAPATNPTTAAGLTPDETYFQWFAAMSEGDITRGIQLSDADEAGKRYIDDVAHLETKVNELRATAFHKLGAAGKNMVEKAVTLRFAIGDYGPAVIEGDTAKKFNARSDKKFLLFKRINGVWKISLTGNWFDDSVASEHRPLQYYCDFYEADAVEVERINGLLDEGSIESVADLRKELAQTIQNLAAYKRAEDAKTVSHP